MAGTADDLPCAASTARTSRGWRGHRAAGRRREAGQEPRARSPASPQPRSALAESQPGNHHHPMPRRGHGLREEKPTGPGQAGTRSPSRRVVSQGGSQSSLLEGDAAGRDRQGRAATRHSVKPEGSDSPLLKRLLKHPGNSNVQKLMQLPEKPRDLEQRPWRWHPGSRGHPSPRAWLRSPGWLSGFPGRAH